MDQSDEYEALEDLWVDRLKRVIRAALICVLTFGLSLTHSYSASANWPLFPAIAILSYGNRTFPVALLAPAFFLLLNLVPPEMATNIGAWLGRAK